MAEENKLKGSAQEVQVLQEQIKQLKEQLNTLNAEKEAMFSKKEESSKKIRALISQVVNAKKERNKLTDFVKEVKVKRTKLNAEISEYLKRMDSMKKSLPKKRGESPGRLREKIEQLNRKIETEVMNFSKEQAINKEIRELKKKLGKAEVEGGSLKDYRKTTQELKKIKKKADAEHKKIQSVAKESQQKHEKILEQSKIIDAIKEEEQKCMAEFLAKKEEFTVVNNKLKDTIKLLHPHKIQLRQDSNERKEQYKKKTKKKLAERKRDAEEKFKKGEKLTTEDLLAIQGAP